MVVANSIIVNILTDFPEKKGLKKVSFFSASPPSLFLTYERILFSQVCIALATKMEGIRRNQTFARLSTFFIIVCVKQSGKKSGLRSRCQQWEGSRQSVRLGKTYVFGLHSQRRNENT
jgi:hypothetical protein